MLPAQSPTTYGAVDVTPKGKVQLRENALVVPAAPEFMRWIALLQFSLLTIGTAASVGTHTVIVSPFRRYFSLTIDQVDFLNTVFLGSYLIVGAGIMKIFTLYGLKGGMRWGSALFLAGAALKVWTVFNPEWFSVMLLAQTMQSIAINFVMAGPSLLSSTWFPDTERTLSTTIASQADNLGIAIATVFPALVVTPQHHGQSEMLVVYGALLAVALLDSFLTFFVVPAAPKRPLSVQGIDPIRDAEEGNAGHEEKHHHRQQEHAPPPEARLSLAHMFRSVSHSRAYMLLAVSTGLAVAAYWTYAAIFAQVLLPYAITQQQAGLLGSIKILIGVVPALMIAGHVDRTREYKKPLMAALATCLVCFAAIEWALNTFPRPFMPVLLLHLPLGVAQAVIMPVAVEFMAEITFPVNPSVSAGVFMYALRVLCTAVIMLTPAMLPAGATPRHADRVMQGYVWMSAVAVALLFLVKGRLRRYEAEHARNVDTVVVFEALIARQSQLQHERTEVIEDDEGDRDSDEDRQE